MIIAWSAGKKRMHVKRPALLLSTMLLLQLAPVFCQSEQVSSRQATASVALAASHTTLVTCTDPYHLRTGSHEHACKAHVDFPWTTHKGCPPGLNVKAILLISCAAMLCEGSPYSRIC